METQSRPVGRRSAKWQWIITGYALTFGSLLLLGGKLGDLLGRKWTFMAGLLGFAGALALGGLAAALGRLITACSGSSPARG